MPLDGNCKSNGNPEQFGVSRVVTVLGSFWVGEEAVYGGFECGPFFGVFGEFGGAFIGEGVDFAGGFAFLGDPFAGDITVVFQSVEDGVELGFAGFKHAFGSDADPFDDAVSVLGAGFEGGEDEGFDIGAEGH